jgi:two-component system, LytTR family, response regulator
MPESLRALLVDDERLARRELAKMLKVHPDVLVVGEAVSVAEAALQVSRLHPNLVFLDIQLAGETGFALLDRIDSHLDFIFVTAYDQYAIRAFEVNALDYLLKPVHPDRLARALNRVREREPHRESASLRDLTYEDRLFLEDGRKSRFVKVSEIVCLRAADDYSEVVLADATKLLVRRPLKEWEARLPVRHFTRIHRSTIVNLEYVDRVEPWFNDSYQVYVRDHVDPLAVSRRHAARLKERFG